MTTTTQAPPAVAGLRPALLDRHRAALAEIVKFLVIGGLATVLDLALANALLFVVGLGPTTSKALSTLAATVASYLLNRAWVFADRVEKGTGQRRDVLAFGAVNGLGLLITLAPVDVAHYLLGLTSVAAFNASSLVGIVLSTAFRFWAYRRFVFPAGRPA